MESHSIRGYDEQQLDGSHSDFTSNIWDDYFSIILSVIVLLRILLFFLMHCGKGFNLLTKDQTKSITNYRCVRVGSFLLGLPFYIVGLSFIGYNIGILSRNQNANIVMSSAAIIVIPTMKLTTSLGYTPFIHGAANILYPIQQFGSVEGRDHTFDISGSTETNGHRNKLAKTLKPSTTTTCSMDVLLFEVNHTTAGMVHTNVMMVLQDSDNLLIVNPMGLVSEDLIGAAKGRQVQLFFNNAMHTSYFGHYIRQFPKADLYASPGHHFQEAATALDPTKRVLYDLEDSAVRLQLETKWICKGQQRIEILPLSHGFSEMLIYVHDHKLIYFNDCLIGSSMSHNFITSVLFDANHKLGLAIQEYGKVLYHRDSVAAQKTLRNIIHKKPATLILAHGLPIYGSDDDDVGNRLEKFFWWLWTE